MLSFTSSVPMHRIVASLDATVEPSGRGSMRYKVASPAHPLRRLRDVISGLQALTVSLSVLLQLRLLHQRSLLPLNVLWHLRWCCNNSWQIPCLCRSAPVRLQVLANRITLLFWLHSRLSLLNDKQELVLCFPALPFQASQLYLPFHLLSVSKCERISLLCDAVAVQSRGRMRGGTPQQRLAPGSPH